MRKECESKKIRLNADRISLNFILLIGLNMYIHGNDIYHQIFGKSLHFC